MGPLSIFGAWASRDWVPSSASSSESKMVRGRKTMLVLLEILMIAFPLMCYTDSNLFLTNAQMMPALPANTWKPKSVRDIFLLLQAKIDQKTEVVTQAGNKGRATQFPNSISGKTRLFSLEQSGIAWPVPPHLKIASRVLLPAFFALSALPIGIRPVRPRDSKPGHHFGKPEAQIRHQ